MGVPARLDAPLNMNVPADADVKRYQPKPANKNVGTSAALSMANTPKESIQTRKIAVLAADGVDDGSLMAVKKGLETLGAYVKIVAPRLGRVKASKGATLEADFSLLTTSSVLFDAVYVPGGASSIAAFAPEPDALEFLRDAFKHCKPIAATDEGIDLLRAADIPVPSGADTNGKGIAAQDGVVTGRGNQASKVASEFAAAVRQHRFWSRPIKPAPKAPRREASPQPEAR